MMAPAVEPNKPNKTYPDLLDPRWRHPINFYKPALGLVLREYIVGPERFDFAFQ